MSELKHTMAMPPAIGGSSIFESAQINSIQGGNYYCNQAGVINQNITNIQSHQRSDVNMEGEQVFNPLFRPMANDGFTN